MKRMLGNFYTISLLAAAISLPSVARAQDSPVGSRFAAEPSSAVEKPLPYGAVAVSVEELKAAEPVTFEELRRFVRDWRKYDHWLKTDGNQYKAVAYLGVSPSVDYPPEVVKWMDEHGWAVDRFFLLERKFRMTLSIQKQETKQVLLTEHIRKQMEQVRDNSSMSLDEKRTLMMQYRNTMRNVRTTTSARAPVTPEEYELIKINHDALARVLAE